MQASDFFSSDDKILIEKAIRDAETNTSGEIRVHVELSCSGSVLDRAANVFARLGMHKTALRNGVLFYLAINNKQFAILGDIGINQAVTDTFWDDIRSIMELHFRNSEFAVGLSEGIRMAGDQLKQHFPYQKDDLNELTDDISFGKDV
jgi:uncharacterized membrane protein